MEKHTQPVFFIGSGRSGTRMIFKLLAGQPDVEVYHEFACTHIQPVAALYAMGRITATEAAEKFKALHGAEIHYSQAKYWMDCSNKLSWIIEPILSVLPHAKFVLVVRDGRKVSSSYFHKLPDEMYDDRSVAILDAWLKEPDRHPMPPPEKKYWWNIPQAGQPFAGEFPGFDHFQRCCYQWRESNRIVLEAFEKLPAAQAATFKLEDMATDPAALRRMIEFTGIPYEESFFDLMQTPQNVIFPMDFQLSEEQTAQFYRIAGDIQTRLGYETASEYQMKY
ncbi:MAG: sulfotransferase [Chthoniobacterales bacterium]